MVVKEVIVIRLLYFNSNAPVFQGIVGDEPVSGSFFKMDAALAAISGVVGDIAVEGIFHTDSIQACRSVVPINNRQIGVIEVDPIITVTGYVIGLDIVVCPGPIQEYTCVIAAAFEDIAKDNIVC